MLETIPTFTRDYYALDGSTSKQREEIKWSWSVVEHGMLLIRSIIDVAS